MEDNILYDSNNKPHSTELVWVHFGHLKLIYIINYIFFSICNLKSYVNVLVGSKRANIPRESGRKKQLQEPFRGPSHFEQHL